MSFNDFRKKEAERKKDENKKSGKALPYKRAFDNTPGKTSNVDGVNDTTKYRRDEDRT